MADFKKNSVGCPCCDECLDCIGDLLITVDGLEKANECPDSIREDVCTELNGNTYLVENLDASGTLEDCDGVISGGCLYEYIDPDIDLGYVFQVFIKKTQICVVLFGGVVGAIGQDVCNFHLQYCRNGTIDCSDFDITLTSVDKCVEDVKSCSGANASVWIRNA